MLTSVYHNDHIIPTLLADTLQGSFLLSDVFLRWFNFEKLVEALVATKTFHMDLDELLTITKLVCRIGDEEELSTMLNFYHDLGVIVKHGRTVVLQARRLIDLFKQLITVPPFDEVVNSDVSCNKHCMGSMEECQQTTNLSVRGLMY